MSRQSEIARLREEIARENQAAFWALHGLAEGTSRHRFISRRMERMGVHQQALSELVGERASMQMVVEIMEQRSARQTPEGLEKGNDDGRDKPTTHPGH